MATRWYWRVSELEMGPVSFLELTTMVREHLLNEDDLVRPEYSKDWQATDSVVGLYYMASRIPVARPPAVRTEVVQELAVEGGGDDLIDLIELAEEWVAPADSNRIPSDGLSRRIDLGANIGVAASSKYPTITPWEAIVASTVSTSKTFVRRSWFFSVLANRKFLVAVFGTVTLLGGWSFSVNHRSADNQRYLALSEILNEIRQQRRQSPSDFRVTRFKIEAIIRDYPEQISREGASRNDVIKQNLLFASRDFLPAMMKTDLSHQSSAEQHLTVSLDEVGRALGIQQP